MNTVANMRVVKMMKCQVSISGGRKVKLKFPAQPIGAVVVSLNDKPLRIYDIRLGRGEEIKVTRIK